MKMKETRGRPALRRHPRARERRFVLHVREIEAIVYMVSGSIHIGFLTGIYKQEGDLKTQVGKVPYKEQES